jgi:hypothetical protein
MTASESWRGVLDPPPGGLVRLMRSVQARQARPPRPALRLALAGAGAAACAALALGLSHYRHEAPRRVFEQHLQAALAAERLERGIARELPSERADVRIVVLAAPASSP